MPYKNQSVAPTILIVFDDEEKNARTREGLLTSAGVELPGDHQLERALRIHAAHEQARAKRMGL